MADSPFNHLPEAPPRAEGAGTVVNTEEASLMIDDRLWDAKATRYQYRSTDSLGNASEDTAIYIDPNKPWTGPGERPLVAVPAGTQGTGQHCDPSLSIQSGPEIRIDPFDMVFPYEAIPVGVHLERGAAVVLIDHHRNADGHQAYLDNIASGQSTLDAIAAAQELGVSPEAPVGIHGYSQGGGAAAAAAERAEVYAPELNIVATAAGGPTVSPGTTIDQFNGTGAGSYSLLALNTLLDKDPALKEVVRGDLSATGQQALDDVRHYCVPGLVGHYGLETDDTWTAQGERLTAVIERYAPLTTEIERQRVGKFVPNAPVFLFHAVNDDIVPFESATQLRNDWEGLGFSELTWHADETIPILPKSATNHALAMVLNLDRAADFVWGHFPR
ncbi:lipase [Corynebacterium yudongzhengii]|uniref:Lipase n=1 Tax=Corynebacterium yudongzhengii TaxID=2080740 RepID=A0A2U1T8N2_9CORY|nr:lipase [Corynebacterium yudongzhengii]PWC02353.1 lipase [Corynebacterium yudongzhengii]